ncbi:MAG: ABC transporter ATP-binding protein [Candidatus Eiseniibacteriota bacterium]
MTVSNGHPALLEVRGAVKSFGPTRALDGASIELRAGERLGLLGPNGAGKTTLVRAILGRVRLDGGAITLDGEPLDDASRRRAVGVAPQEIALYPLLNARENLEAFGELNGVSRRELAARVKWALEWTALAEHSRRPVRQLSGGMKRRLNVACGVLHQPRVLLLDEPTVGVDPQSRERLYGMLEMLREQGTSVLLATHHLEEAEARCDRIAILDHGRLVASGTLAELVQHAIGAARGIVVSLLRPLPAVPEGFLCEHDARRLVAQVGDLDAELPRLIERVHAAGGSLTGLEVVGGGLHDVFLRLTGRELRE